MRLLRRLTAGNRAEFLNMYWFMSIPDAQQKLEPWRRDYNEQRPHCAIGNNTPISLVFSDFVTSPKSENQIESPN